MWHLLHLHSIQNMVANLCIHDYVLIVPFDPCLQISIYDFVCWFFLFMLENQSSINVAFICINWTLLCTVHAIFKLVIVIYCFVLLLSFRANISQMLQCKKIYMLWSHLGDFVFWQCYCKILLWDKDKNFGIFKLL